MKNYTDIEQSKKLAEILPLESADMRYGYIAPYDYSDRMYDGGYDDVPYPKDFLKRNPNFSENEYDGEFPCWSLMALLNILPNSIYDNTDEFSQLEFTKKSVAYIQGINDSIKIGILKDNLIDACYEMIIHLNELNLL